MRRRRWRRRRRRRWLVGVEGGVGVGGEEGRWSGAGGCRRGAGGELCKFAIDLQRVDNEVKKDNAQAK